MKRYVILAGVNGAGKTTLFSLIPSLAKIDKVNMDEIVREIGDWKDTETVIKAGKIAVNRIDRLFQEEKSFSQETTLCGRSIIGYINRAKEQGYCIEMHYVGVDSPDIAKERVKNRVSNGGHGISDKDIERRYKETLEKLKEVLPVCDLVAIYDNSFDIRRFAIYKQGVCVKISKNVPRWFKEL